jgi:hypothetical protein
MIELYCKTTGKAGQENKYEFPPPMDKILFFGNCVLINTNGNGDLKNLTDEEWNKIYTKLYGGFEDIGSEDSDEEEEEDLSGINLTKSGYEKDGFIVEDDELDVEDEDSDYHDDSENEVKVFSKKSKITKPKVKAAKKAKVSKTSKSNTIEKLSDMDGSETTTTSTKEQVQVVKKTVSKCKKNSKSKNTVENCPNNLKSENQSDSTDSYLNCDVELKEEAYI